METTKKVGRKPLGERPLTSTEKSRRKRERFKESGGRRFSIDICAQHVRVLELLSSASNQAPTRILNDLMDIALVRLVNIANEADKLHQLGATDSQVTLFIKSNLYPPVQGANDENTPCHKI